MPVNGEPTRVSHAFEKKKYGSIHEATRAIRSLLVWKCSTYRWPRLRVHAAFLHSQCANRRFGLLYRNILYRNCNDIDRKKEIHCKLIINCPRGCGHEIYAHGLRVALFERWRKNTIKVPSLLPVFSYNVHAIDFWWVASASIAPTRLINTRWINNNKN